ncbi:hypothetical protein RCL1_004584 [Eukaryota sp. TZLM3-RCL]
MSVVDEEKRSRHRCAARNYRARKKSESLSLQAQLNELSATNEQLLQENSELKELLATQQLAFSLPNVDPPPPTPVSCLMDLKSILLEEYSKLHKNLQSAVLTPSFPEDELIPLLDRCYFLITNPTDYLSKFLSHRVSVGRANVAVPEYLAFYCHPLCLIHIFLVIYSGHMDVTEAKQRRIDHETWLRSEFREYFKEASLDEERVVVERIMAALDTFELQSNHILSKKTALLQKLEVIVTTAIEHSAGLYSTPPTNEPNFLEQISVFFSFFKVINQTCQDWRDLFLKYISVLRCVSPYLEAKSFLNRHPFFTAEEILNTLSVFNDLMK